MHNEEKKSEHVHTPHPVLYKRDLIPVAKLFSNTWKLLISRLKTLIGISLISYLMLIFFLFTIALSIAFGVFGFGMLSGDDFSIFWLLSPLMLLFIVAMVFVTIWAQIAMLFVIKDHHEKIGIREAFSRGFGKVLPLWWISLLSGLLAFGAFFVFIIPGIVFSIWFSFAIYILISENIGGFRALLKSRALVVNRWWRVFGRIIALSVVTSFIMYIPALIFGEFGRNSFDINILLRLYFIVISLLLTPFSLIYMYLLYKNLKETSITAEVKTTQDKRLVVGVSILGYTILIALLIWLVSTVLPIIENFFQQHEDLPNNETIFTIHNERARFSISDTRRSSSNIF